MIRAFIHTCPRDYQLALACTARMRQLGWSASILADPREWEIFPTDALPANYSTLGRGMFGIDCALGIADGILAHSQPGDIVLKSDCDVWLSATVSAWLSLGERARVLRLNKRANCKIRK